MFATILTTVECLTGSSIINQTGKVPSIEWLENIQNIIYPTIIGGYIILSTIRKSIDKVKEKEAVEKKKESQATILRNKKKFADFAHQESMQYMINMKNICNRYRDRFYPDRVHFLQIENGTIAITGVYNMYITCIAEDDRYSDLPRVYTHVNRIPYNRLTSLLQPLLDMKPHLQNVLEVNGKDETSAHILNELKEVYSVKIGSCMALPIFDNEGCFVGCVSFDYSQSDFNDRDINQQKEALKDFQIAIHTMIESYNTNLINKRKELRLPIEER